MTPNPLVPRHHSQARAIARLGGVCLLVAALAAAGVAQAQSAPKSDSLTWNGITLYGIVDIGVQYDTHGTPASDYFPPGTESIILKNSNKSVSAVTPSNLGQSRLGLSGNEPLVGDWAGVFKLEMFFNPQSGDISDALKSIALNNGRALAEQSTNVDSSIAGQLFSGAAYAGFSSPTYGTFTFGRNTTPLADGIGKYDPLSASNAFSLIGFSGTTAGGGDTEDRRLDESLKYAAKYSWVHLGALYQFSGANGSQNTAWQLQIGADFPGGSIDLYATKKYDAIGVSALSAAQVATLPALGLSPSNSLAATVSDNKSFAAMAYYDVGPVKLLGGYEHIDFNNPNTPLTVGSLTIGGYVLAVVNNTAFTNQKTLQVFWAGLRWPITPSLHLLTSYYGYKQDAFAGGANAGCSSTISAACSGTENAFSVVLDYRLSKRFDVYLGTFYTGVKDGLASGFLNTSMTATTAGLKFVF